MRRMIEPDKAPTYVGAQVIIDSETMIRATPAQMDELIAIKMRAVEMTLRHQIAGWVERWTVEGGS